MPYFGVPIRNGISPGLGSVIGFGSRNPIQAVITALFGAGEQGIAVPDLSPNNGFLFQDSATPTTPVTAFEQKVGYILDRSGRGNHIRTTNSTSAPTLSAKYNLLTYSEDLSNGDWTKYRSPVMTYNADVAPNGTTTADLIAPTAAGGTNAGVFQTRTLTGSQSYTFKFYVKAKSWTWLHVNSFAGATGVWFNIATGAVGTQTNSMVGAIQAAANGYYLCTITGPSGSGTNYIEVGLVDADNSLTCTGNSVNGAYFWGFDFRLTIDTIAQPAYQRVGASTDYDTAGFYPYLIGNGSTQFMRTAATLDGTGSGSAQIFAGTTKLSDAALSLVMEHGADSTAATGIGINAPSGASATLGVTSYGSAAASVSVSALAAPLASVETAYSEIATPTLVLRRNGASIGTSATSQGSGTYANSTAYFLSRAGTGQFYGGRLYPFFMRFGTTPSAGVISQVENFIKARMPISY